MRPPVYLRAILLSAAAFGACIISGPSELGISSAEAKPYYTRKRVNGEWITGRFAKRHAPAKRKMAGRPARARSVTSTAALGRPLPSEDAPTPEPRPGNSNPALVVAASETASTASPPPLTSDERLLKLQEALQARANSLTTGGTGTPAPAVSGPAPAVAPVNSLDLGNARAVAPPREPRSVSLDFKTGIKTTLFTDGASVEERFDVSSLKGLASPPPERSAENAPLAAKPRP